MLIRKTNKNQRKVGLGAGFMNYVFIDSTNKLDSNIVITGIDEILYNSDFIAISDELGYNLARDGVRWGLVAYPIDGSAIIELAHFQYFEIVAGKLTLAYVTSKGLKEINGIMLPYVEKFELVNGQVIKTMGWFENENSFYVDSSAERIVYETDVIPAWPFKYSSRGEGAIPSELFSAIEAMDFFSNQIPKEWEKIKTNFLFNKVFMPNKRGEDVVEAMTNGGDVTEITDPNGQLGGALATLSSGSSTPDILNNQIVFLENRILKYAMLSTDLVMGKAAQQSVSETSKVDRQVLEHLIKLNALRKYNYQRFFDALGKMVGVEIGVELPLPFVDQYQIDSLKANLKVLEGQATSQMATAQQEPETEEVPVEGE